MPQHILSKLHWWCSTVFVLKDQDTLMTSFYQFTPLELVLDYDLQITVTWSSHVHAMCVLVSGPLHLCRTTFHPNWRMSTLVDRVLNLALSCNRCLRELCISGTIYSRSMFWFVLIWCCSFGDKKIIWPVKMFSWKFPKNYILVAWPNLVVVYLSGNEVTLL